jgi:V/A-type H+/Na+-transporting ATPase subunit C
MSDFDYGNARLRAMKSRLLAKRELESLAESNSLSGLIAALTRSAYRKSVEVALARSSGMDCIAEALRLDLISTLGNVSAFYPDRARQMVAIVLRTYDVHNLKTILRGLNKNVSEREIIQTLLPIGNLNLNLLMALTRAPGPRGVVDMLASMNLPIAQPLLHLRAEHPGAEVNEMELALDRWHFFEAANLMKREFRTEEALFAALQLDADITNLLTVMRFAYAPAERKLASGRSGVLDIERLFVGPGRLPFALLARAANQETVEAAVEILSGTPYAGSMMAGLQAYTQSNRLSSFEKHLRRYRLNWMSRLISKDPLGIGVLIGYLAQKTNEVGNIRWIAHGISLDLKPNAIRSELELIT